MSYSLENSPTTEDERRRGMVILFCGLMVVGMGQTLFNAVLPPIARQFGMTEVETSLIFALSAIMWMVMSPVWGRTSDRVGRKPIIIIGVLGFGFSTLSFSLVVWAGLEGLLTGTGLVIAFIAARTIFGVFGSGTMPSANAYIADRTSRQDRSAGVARIAAAFGVGIVIGPMIAGTLLEFGTLVPFLAVGAMALTAAAAVAFLLPERSKPQAMLGGRHRMRMRYFDRRTLPIVLISLAIAFSQAIEIQAVGFYFMDRLGFSAEEAASYIAVGFAMMGLAGLVAQFVIIQHFRISVQTMLRWGAILGIATFLILAATADFGLAIFALMLSGFGFGLLRPGLSSAASLIVEPDEQGAVAGIIGSTAAIGHVLNPIIGMPLYQLDARLPFLLAAGLLGLCLLVILAHPRIRNVRTDDEDNPPPIKPPEQHG